MNPLIIDNTKKSPAIQFADGSMVIEGRSTMNDPLMFYKPLIEWTQKYVTSYEGATSVLIRLEYFDTSSSKHILEILKIMDDFFRSGKDVKVEWVYEEGDDDIHDIGVYFESFVRIPFSFTEQKEPSA